MWTTFFDMFSGGEQKTPYSYIFIEAPKETAIQVFETLFKIDPYNITCNCCGEDFAIYEDESLETATTYLKKEEKINLKTWLKNDFVKVIYEKEITT